MYDKSSVYPKIENSYVFKVPMKVVLLTIFEIKLLLRTVITAIFKLIYYDTPNLLLQHLPVKEKVKEYRLIE